MRAVRRPEVRGVPDVKRVRWSPPVDEAAHSDRVRMVVLTLAPVLAVAGGILAASRLLAVNQSGSTDVMLMAIAAAVIGGTSLFGPRPGGAAVSVAVTGP